MNNITKRLAALLEVKSIVTILMTMALLLLLFTPAEPSREITGQFSTVYAAVITYFFTRKDAKSK